jgi:SAM-dependent methyltransferase
VQLEEGLCFHELLSHNGYASGQMNRKIFCSSEADLTASLMRWFSEPPGSILLEQERVCLEELLSGLFGYYLVQVGCLGMEAEPLRASKIRNQIVVSTSRLSQETASCVRSEAESLPLLSDGVDAVLLPHTLDFSAEPHQVLREAERILIPEGRVVIVGFNPLSLWGFWRLVRRHRGRVPWCGQFLSPRRISDWLSLLGFDVEETRGLMYRPPVGHQASMEKMAFLEHMGDRFWPLLSGVYVIKAVKRVSTLTPVEPAWKIRKHLLGGRLVEPTTRTTTRE